MKSNSNGALSSISLSRNDVPAPDKLKALFATNRGLLQKTVQKLAKFNQRQLDDIVHKLHHEAFGFYDCLDCSNCCRSISPAISHNDVEAMAKKLKVRPSDLVGKHLKLDEEGDFVFHTAPCPFIDDDNYCHIYSHRPKACGEYPHTNRSRFYQILNLSLKNAEICPVVYAILMKLA